jgi:ubiquinone/menaquinone biosynthesis C-methylase UbiE
MSAASSVPVNHWPDDACARAFWGQQELPPYRRLLRDTADWLTPKAGERWIDLGCGSGQLTKALWEKSCGTLAEVVALDCADANGKVIEKLCRKMNPAPKRGQVRFLCADFSSGLGQYPDNSFEGAVSGLAIQYAESFCPRTGSWTSQAYDGLLRDVYRVLKPGAWFVFSVNVPPSRR